MHGTTIPNNEAVCMWDPYVGDSFNTKHEISYWHDKYSAVLRSNAFGFLFNIVARQRVLTCAVYVGLQH